MIQFSETIENEQQLEELLSRPTAEVVDLFKNLEGDIIFPGHCREDRPFDSKDGQKGLRAGGCFQTNTSVFPVLATDRNRRRH